MSPKSVRADGAPKKRWTAAERAARGHTPRRSGGRPRSLTESRADVQPTRPASRDRRLAAPVSSTEGPRSRSAAAPAGPGRPYRSSARPVESRPPRGERPFRAESPEQPISTAGDAQVPAGDFASLGLAPELVAVLTAQDITQPFPIQAATIPDAVAGRDVLGRGRTGSGKTLAFGLPMMTRLSAGTDTRPRGVVLVPTRELAMQVADVLTPLAATANLSVVLVAGGMSYTPQLRAFARGVDVVVATPGRLIDLMDQGAVDLGRVEVTVLDEADHMADLGFLPAVTQILDAVPAGGQRMLFSATLDGAVDQLVADYLENPVVHEVDASRATVTTMEHYLLQVTPSDKAPVTAELASRDGRTVIFVRTQLGADRVAQQLRAAGVLAGALHGGLAQGARTRILSVFKDGQLPVLVATDVAARGIHVDDIGLVLQVDPPAGPKEYLHRAGRTARAGGTGVVATLVLPHQRRELDRLTRQAGVRAIGLSARPGDPQVAAATGARRPAGTPVSDAAYERLIAPPPARHRSSGPRSRGRRDFDAPTRRPTRAGRGGRPQRSPRPTSRTGTGTSISG